MEQYEKRNKEQKRSNYLPGCQIETDEQENTGNKWTCDRATPGFFSFLIQGSASC